MPLAMDRPRWVAFCLHVGLGVCLACRASSLDADDSATGGAFAAGSGGQPGAAGTPDSGGSPGVAGEAPANGGSSPTGLGGNPGTGGVGGSGGVPLAAAGGSSGAVAGGGTAGLPTVAAGGTAGAAASGGTGGLPTVAVGGAAGQTAVGAAGTAGEGPVVLPPDPCHGLAGIHEVVPLEPTPDTMRPWVFLTETNEGDCEVRVGDTWNDTATGNVQWSEDTLTIDGGETRATGDGTYGGLDWLWSWHFFHLDLLSDGSLAGTGRAGFYCTQYSMDQIDFMGDVETEVQVAPPVSLTELRCNYSNGRDAALPWDSSIEVEASRPMRRLAEALGPVAAGSETWTTVGERSASAAVGSPWDDLEGLSAEIPLLDGVLDDAGRALTAGGPAVQVMNVGAPAAVLEFSSIPPASFGRVAIADPAPTGCIPGGCVEVYVPFEGPSGVAWQLDTTGATEARVTFAVPDGESPTTYLPSYSDILNQAQLTATRPDRTPAARLPLERDESAGTVTERFAVDGAERLGFEFNFSGSWQYLGPLFYLVSTEAR